MVSPDLPSLPVNSRSGKTSQRAPTHPPGGDVDVGVECRKDRSNHGLSGPPEWPTRTVLGGVVGRYGSCQRPPNRVFRRESLAIGPLRRSVRTGSFPPKSFRIHNLGARHRRAGEGEPGLPVARRLGVPRRGVLRESASRPVAQSVGMLGIPPTSRCATGCADCRGSPKKPKFILR